MSARFRNWKNELRYANDKGKTEEDILNRRRLFDRCFWQEGHIASASSLFELLDKPAPSLVDEVYKVNFTGISVFNLYKREK